MYDKRMNQMHLSAKLEMHLLMNSKLRITDRLTAPPGLPQCPENLHPICLVEVLRKLWIGISVDRIKAVWRQHGVLDEAQHGFRGQRGTDSALLSIKG